MPFLPVTELKVTIRARFPYKNRKEIVFIYILLSQKKKKKENA